MKWLFGLLKRLTSSSGRLTADTSKAAYTWGDQDADEYSELAVSRNIGASSDTDTDIHAYVRQGYASSESGGYRQEVYARCASTDIFKRLTDIDACVGCR
jgi:hypothetical protein